MNESSLKQSSYLQSFKLSLGNTPIIKIDTNNTSANIYAKCEWNNPYGSIKDRAAYSMIVNLLDGIPYNNWNKLHILEYSGGNLSISLANICYQLGISVTLVLSSGVGKSLLDQLNKLNVDVHLVDKTLGFWGVMEYAKKLSERNPNWSFLYQHTNRHNINAHRNGTGQEILEWSKDIKLNALVTSVGTGGTLIGIYEALITKFPSIELHMVMPAELTYGSEDPPNGSRKFAGSGGFGCGQKQTFVSEKEQFLTKEWNYSFNDTLLEMKSFYEKTGIKIGTSAAANLLAAKQVANSLGQGYNVMTIFPDSGSEEEWESANKLSDSIEYFI